MASYIVPPGGAAGFAQMTRASQVALSSAVRPTSSRGPRRAKRAKSTRRAKRAKSSGGKKRYNSAAWMAKIRKLRGKGKRKR